MIYEEKHNAFRRLQLEILKQRDDHTLFAWRVPQMRTGQPDLGTGLLAESPEAFANSTSVVQADHHTNISHYSMNNKGIHIRLPLVPLEKLAELYTTSGRAVPNCGGGQTCVVMLECRNGSARIGLYLRRARGDNTWNRVRAHEFGQLPTGASPSPLLQNRTEMYIQDLKSNYFWKFWNFQWQYHPSRNHIFVFKNRNGLAPGREAVQMTNEGQDNVKWNMVRDDFEVKVINRECWALMNFITSTGGSVSVRLAFPSQSSLSPCCSIHDMSRAPGFEHMSHVVDGLGSVGDASSTSLDGKCSKDEAFINYDSVELSGGKHAMVALKPAQSRGSKAYLVQVWADDDLWLDSLGLGGDDSENSEGGDGDGHQGPTGHDEEMRED